MLKIKKTFDQVADVYDEWYKQPLGKYVLEAELDALNFLLPTCGLGADVGAGTGIFVKRLITKNRSIICVDISAKMLSRALERRLQAIVGTAQLPPIKPQSLDFIYLVTTIEFLHKPAMALSSLRALLKPKCPIVVLSINKTSSWGKMYAEASEKGDAIFKHAHFYTPKEVIIFFEEANYEVTQIVGTLTNPPNVIPKQKSRLVSPEDMPIAGVFLVKGQKRQNYQVTR